MDLKVKEITSFIENDVRKTRIIISENDREKEIILEGNGQIKEPVEV